MESQKENGIRWGNIVLAALMMVATLPGRTQGLGLITEPLLQDLHLDRILFADINLWATLLGSAACLPAGWLLDRFGLRWCGAIVIWMLALVVWGMSIQSGSVALLFLLILGTRALGQSALSVISISAVGKTSGQRVGFAMGFYAILLSILFAASFLLVGGIVRNSGWRSAWARLAWALGLFIAPVVLLCLRDSRARKEVSAPEATPQSFALLTALRTPAFWIFAGAASLFGLVSSGLGLFNEAVLAERGFDQKIYHEFLAVTTLMALAGQLLCGWLTLRWSMQRLMGVAMFVYAIGLAALPTVKTLTGLWGFALLIGLAAGMVTVLFFAIWSQAFGSAQLGRIQGAAQMLTVFASALGPLLFAKCHGATGSYSPLLLALAPIVFGVGVAAWLAALPSLPEMNAAKPVLSN